MPVPPARGGEDGFEDVRALAVAALGLESLHGLEPEGAAALGVEDAREDARRVDVGEAEPVDRAVARDERAGTAVADQGVFADRGVAVDAFHVSDSTLAARP